MVGGLILLAVGIGLRRLLGLGTPEAPRRRGFVTLDPELEAIYRPIALEVETQSAILAISLNEAIAEAQSGRQNLAWRLVRLTASEWDRLAEIINILADAVARYLPVAQVAVPVRGMVAHRFKSSAMINYARLHEFLEQLVFRSRLRVQLHLHVLRHAVDALTAEFHRAYREAEHALDLPPELWSRVDFTFHDFDLVAKEVLLAFRAFLPCLPSSALRDFAAEFDPVVQHGVRSTSIPADR